MPAIKPQAPHELCVQHRAKFQFYGHGLLKRSPLPAVPRFGIMVISPQFANRLPTQHFIYPNAGSAACIVRQSIR